MYLYFLLAALMLLIPTRAHGQFELKLVNLGMGYGMQNGRAYGTFEYADSIANLTLIARDQIRDELEARFYVQVGESLPSGYEPFRLGFVFTQDRETRPDWLIAGDPAPTKVYLSLKWRVAGGMICFDQPMGSVISGQRCYPRFRAEDIELPILTHGATAGLTGRILYDLDPTIGSQADLGVFYRNADNTLEVVIMSKEYRLRAGFDVSF